MKINNNISIVTACYNEENKIKKTINSWLKYFKKKLIFKKFEIVITDDGSTDKTFEVLSNLKKKNKQIKVYKFKKNMGASFAFNNSIKKSKYEFILVNDSDNQFPINNTSYLWKEMKKRRSDVIIGSRNRLKELTFLSIGSFISSKIMNVIYGSKIDDFNCALRLSKSNILKKIKLNAFGLNYSTEMTAKMIEMNSKIYSIKIFHNKNDKKKTLMHIFKDSINRILFVNYLFLRKILSK
jgi:glycosyltransferase involved in cell wall biosynthesis